MGLNYISNFTGDNYCQWETSGLIEATSVTTSTIGEEIFWVVMDDSPIIDSVIDGLFAQYQLRDRDRTFGEFVEENKWDH